MLSALLESPYNRIFFLKFLQKAEKIIFSKTQIVYKEFNSQKSTEDKSPASVETHHTNKRENAY